MNCTGCGTIIPFVATSCPGRPPTLQKEPASLTISSINLSNCRRCHQRKPLPFVLESPNGHASLRICRECSEILDAITAGRTMA